MLFLKLTILQSFGIQHFKAVIIFCHVLQLNACNSHSIRAASYIKWMKGLLSQENVVPFRWTSKTKKFGFTQVNKGI